MNTQAIPSPANILAPAPASGNAASPADAAEIPFNQVLQREVHDRRNAEQTAKPDGKQSSEKTANPDAAAQASAETGKKDAVAAKDKDAAKPEEESDELSDAANASAELIALVANMAQIRTSADAKPASFDGASAQLDPGTAGGKGKPLALSAEELAKQAQPDDGSRPTGDLLNAGKDFAQTAKDAAKASVSAVQPQQHSAAQTTGLQGGAIIPLDSLAAQQAGLTPEAGTSNSVSPLSPMQQAFNKVQAATTQAADTLAPPVGTPAWDQAVGQKVVWMVAGAQQSASLTLNPPDLGPMQIVLNVNNAQANATFVAAQPEVRQALEAALPRLREMLSEAGIQLGQTNINAGTPQHGNGSERDGRQASSGFSQSGNNEQPLAPARSQPLRQGLGMVDTFA